MQKFAILSISENFQVFEAGSMDLIWNMALEAKRPDQKFSMGTYKHYLALPGEQTVRILNTNTLYLYEYDIESDAAVIHITWHPNGRYLAASTLDKRIMILDLVKEESFSSEPLKHRVAEFAWLLATEEGKDDSIVFTLTNGKIGWWTDMKLATLEEPEALPFKYARVVTTEPINEAEEAVQSDKTLVVHEGDKIEGTFFDKYIGIYP
jgi:WD40 repeat protein